MVNFNRGSEGKMELLSVDITIVKGRYQTLIKAVSIKGSNWLFQNMLSKPHAEICIYINTEFVDELIEELKKHNLEVEVK